MSYWIANGLGDSQALPSAAVMKEYLLAIDPLDTEHGAAWLSDEDGNSIEYNGNGVAVFDRGDDPPKHMFPVSIDRVIELWQMLSARRLDELEALPWAPGLRPASTRPEIERHRAESEAHRVEEQRRFIESLGPELSEKCKVGDCPRGCVQYSVFCAQHHLKTTLPR